MKISEAQATVDHWIQTLGVRYFNELTNTAILMEEVGELARIMARRYGEQSEKDSDKGKDLGANQTGIDLEKALIENLAKKTQRDAERHLNNPKLKNDSNQ